MCSEKFDDVLICSVSLERSLVKATVSNDPKSTRYQFAKVIWQRCRVPSYHSPTCESQRGCYLDRWQIPIWVVGRVLSLNLLAHSWKDFTRPYHYY